MEGVCIFVSTTRAVSLRFQHLFTQACSWFLLVLDNDGATFISSDGDWGCHIVEFVHSLRGRQLNKLLQEEGLFLRSHNRRVVEIVVFLGFEFQWSRL